MSQIQAGTTYNSTSNRFITISNLNGHVNNAILTTGAITEQNALVGTFQLTDSIIAHDASSGELVKATIEDLFDSVPDNIPVKNLNGKVDEDIFIKPILDGEFPQKTQILSDLYVSGGIGLNNSIVNPNVTDPSTVSLIQLGYDDNASLPDLSIGNKFELWGATTEFKQTIDPVTEDERDHNVNIEGSLEVTKEATIKDLTVTGSFTVDGGYIETSKYFTVTNATDVNVGTVAGTYGHMDIWESAAVVGAKQVEVTMPEILMRTLNSDNSGTMLFKLELIAKNSTEAVEWVIACASEEGSGGPFGLYHDIDMKPSFNATFLTPSDIDLSNRKLYIRFTSKNSNSSDRFKVLVFNSMIKVRNIIGTAGTPYSTPYTSRSQTTSDSDLVTGGALFTMTSKNFVTWGF
jgi:hypothetical protein